MALGVLQQHDGLAVRDLALLHHAHGLLQRQFQHFDVFALVGDAAAFAHARVGFVFGHEKMQPLRDRSGTHVSLVHLAHLLHAVARFLLHLGPDALFGTGAVEQASRRLDQKAVVAVAVGGKAELAYQHHAAPGTVVQQDGGAVAAVVGLARHGLPAAVAAAVVEGGLLQQIPVMRQGVDALDADVVVGHCETPAEVKANLLFSTLSCNIVQYQEISCTSC